MCGGEVKSKNLKGSKVFGPAYDKLVNVISETEKRYDCKLYIDSVVGNMPNWLQTCVYLHGDRNIINIVAIKIMRWQHSHLDSWDNCYMYVYPAEDMEKNEEANKKAYKINV